MPESKDVFIGLLGAGIALAGLECDAAPATRGEIAATIAALLGEGWDEAEPRAGAPLPVMHG